MPVTFELPAELEQSLREEFPDLDRAAKEALVVELYRDGKISHYKLAQALGLDRHETEEVLKRHHVVEDLPTPPDLDSDRGALERVLGPVQQ